MSGWNLTAALMKKHVGVLGDTVAEHIAAFDPETATAVDRDNLKAKLGEVALKLAAARSKYTAAQNASDLLASQIATDEKASAVLIQKLTDKQIDEATVNQFADNLESQKARLPGVQADAASAKQLQDTLQQILDTVQHNLQDFDAKARQATSALNQARAEEEREALRQQNQRELSELANGVAGHTSTGVSALQHAADKARIRADAAHTVSDIEQKPLDAQAAVEEARHIAAGGAPAGTESAADRLRRIAGTAK